MALSADPDYALAIAGLADTYFMLSFYGWMPTIEGYAKTKSLLVSALKLDKNLSEAHATMGALLYLSEWKWEEARNEFLLATELNPKYTVARQYYAEFLDITGDNKEAREQLNCALVLDPFSPVLYALSAKCYYHEGKFDDSLQDCQKVEELDPETDDIYWRTFLIYVWQSKEPKAVEALKQHISRKKMFTAKDAKILDQVFLQSKINGVLKYLIESESKKSQPDVLALAKYCAMQGKKLEALKWIETALRKRLPGISGIYNDPDFENLRREIRYKAVIKKIGLSDYGNSIAVHLK
jgi:tetratricopeptide (TPR) repeat protein